MCWSRYLSAVPTAAYQPVLSRAEKYLRDQVISEIPLLLVVIYHRKMC